MQLFTFEEIVENAGKNGQFLQFSSIFLNFESKIVIRFLEFGPSNAGNIGIENE